MGYVERLPTYLIYALCVYAIVDLAHLSETLFAQPDAIWLQVIRGGTVGLLFVWIGRRLGLFGQAAYDA